MRGATSSTFKTRSTVGVSSPGSRRLRARSGLTEASKFLALLMCFSSFEASVWAW